MPIILDLLQWKQFSFCHVQFSKPLVINRADCTNSELAVENTERLCRGVRSWTGLVATKYLSVKQLFDFIEQS